MALAVVKENVRPTSQGVYAQVQSAVPINIYQCGARTIEVRAGNSCAFGNIFEFPVSQVAVEVIAAFQPAEIEVAPAVTVHITGRNARAAGEDLTGQQALFRNGIGEEDARLWGHNEGDPIIARPNRLQVRSAVARTRFPFKGLRDPCSEDDR